MALSSCMIDGTAHLLKGGKTVIDGTAYSLENPNASNGRGSGITVVGGTYYHIYLPPWDMYELGKAVSGCIYAGYDSATAGIVSLTLPSAGTYFVFSITNGHCGIYKVVYNGSTSTKSLVIRSTEGANIYCNGATIMGANNDTSTAGTARYGATLVALTFNAHPDLVTATFKKYTLTKMAGRNANTASTVRCERELVFPSNGALRIVATGEYFIMDTVASASGYTITDGLYWHAPAGVKNSMLRSVSSSSVIYSYLTLDESTNASVYGGSIVIATPNS